MTLITKAWFKQKDVDYYILAVVSMTLITKAWFKLIKNLKDIYFYCFHDIDYKGLVQTKMADLLEKLT